MNAEIVILGRRTGADGLSGRDWLRLAEEAAGAGLDLAYATTVVMREREVMDAIRHALTRARLVVVCGPGGRSGGAEPGSGEMVKKALSRILDRRLILNEELLERSRSECSAAAGRDSGALLPSGSVPITGPDGCTAGFYLEERGSFVVYLAGIDAVPGGMVPEGAAAKLRSRSRRRTHTASETVRTYGISMQAVTDALSDGVPEGISMFMAEGPDGIDVTVSAEAETADKVRDTVHEGAKSVVERLGANVYASGAEGMESAAARLLNERGLTIATAESCTGGLIAKRLTDVPGSTAYMERGMVTYSNRSKSELLGVPMEVIEEHGAVSEQTARAMAEGARWYSNTDVGLSATGIAGPGGGTDEKPVGLVYIGLATEDEVTVKRCIFSGSRSEIRYATSQKALDMVRRHLAG